MTMPDQPSPGTPLLAVKDLAQRYTLPRDSLFKPAAQVHALNGVTAQVMPGRSLGVVGESGSGKSTFARLVMALERPSAGTVSLLGRDLNRIPPDELRRARRDFQMVFQDPYGSLDPRQTIARIVAEPLTALGRIDRGTLRDRVATVLRQVGLRDADMDKFPHEFSGGQRQRIAIARALITQPKLIVAGGSAYSRAWDFKRFREIADSVGAYLLVDMAHFAGLVAGGVHASPVPHAHVTTTTTHKSLRGPRGGLILTNDETLAKKLNSAIFPGLQGGPLMHVIAAKAVAFAEALRPDFKVYAKNVVENAKALAETLRSHGLDIVSGGTDNHLMLVDLRPKGLKGNISEKALVRAAITCNKNGIPFDPEKPFVTSGLRLGTPAATTRGFGVAEFKQVGGMIAEVLNALAQSPDGKAPLVEAAIKERVKALTDRFPIYQ